MSLSTKRPVPAFTDWDYQETAQVTLAIHPETNIPIRGIAERKGVYSRDIRWFITYAPLRDEYHVLAKGTATSIPNAMEKIKKAWKTLPPF